MWTLLLSLLTLTFATSEHAQGGKHLKEYQEGIRELQYAHYSNARKHLTLAVNLAREKDPKSLDVVKSLLALARLHRLVGEYALSARLCAQAEKLLDPMSKEHKPMLAASLDERAHLSHLLGFFQEAERSARRSYEMRKTLFGKKHLATVSSVETLSMMGEAYEWFRGPDVVGKYGISIRSQVLKVRETQQGKDHPDLVPGLLHVAMEEDNLKEAQKLIERAERITRKALGGKHPLMAQSLVARASATSSPQARWMLPRNHSARHWPSGKRLAETIFHPRVMPT